MNEFDTVLMQLAAGAGAGLRGMMIPLVLILAILYFLILRPQKKKDKERRDLLASLRRNDRVVTIGGIHGVIVAVKENEVILKVDPQKDVTLKMNKSAVSRVVTGEDEEEKKG